MTKLLLVSAIAPYPTTSGGATRLAQTIRYLGEKYELYLLYFAEQPPTPSEQQELARHCAWSQHFPLRRRTFWSRWPYYFSCWDNPELTAAMRQIITEQHITRVRVELTQIAYLVDEIPTGVQTTFVAYDVSAISFARRVSEQRHWGKKLWAMFNTAQIQRFERRYLPRYDEVVAMSSVDQEQLEQRYGLQHVRIEPNGLQAVEFLARPRGETVTFGFLGSPVHPPNLGAINFIVDKICPLLDAAGVKYRCLLAGDNPAQFANPHIVNLGFVPDQREFFAQLDWLVAPLFAGSGTRLKILESLSYGVPVLTTDVGAEGLDIDSPYLQIYLIGDSDKLAQTLANVLAQPAARAALDDDKVRTQLAAQLQPYQWAASFRDS